MDRKNVAIVGAGLAGLSCARYLQRDLGEHVQVTVFEKSRSLGGRCATRKFHEHMVDHGAQYFTAEDPVFHEFLDELPEDECLSLELPIRNFDGTEFVTPKGARYYLQHGNNTLGRVMAEDLNIQREVTIEHVEPADDGRVLVDDTPFDLAVLAVPLPQMAFLLNQPEPDGYFPNLTAFFEYQAEPAGLSLERYALVDHREKTGNPAAWSACENHKKSRVAPGKTVYVVQASEDFSWTHLEDEPEKWLPILQEELEKLWELDPATRGRVFGHRWRFARVKGPLMMPFDLPDCVFVAGDFQEISRVEAAWMSGHRAGQQIAEYLGLM